MMLRRALSDANHVHLSGAFTAASLLQSRSITSRGQYNPIHNFDIAIERHIHAKDEAEFESLITNPGPLRVGYSPDYLDWLYRAYKAKVRHTELRERARKKFSGSLLSHSDDGVTSLPGAPPPGHFLRPAHSLRRLSGEAKRSIAQQTLDDVARRQGLLDLFERQAQFPTIHIDKASRVHVVEMFKEMVLDRALDPTEIWDKALLYRAILSERELSYPESFKYIFRCIEETVWASEPDRIGASSEASSPLTNKCPTKSDYYYFLYLVRRYYIDNAVEGHVVLRCHRETAAADLLFSNPPPKDDQEVRRGIFDKLNPSAGHAGGVKGEQASTPDGAVPASAIRVPTSYPPIQALWRCEENLPLLTILVFGELNLVVTENPFIKFPKAHGFLTRPYALEGQTALEESRHHRRGQSGGGRREMSGISLTNLIAEKRGHLLAPIPRNISNELDSRAHDLQRLQQRYHREDIVGFQQVLQNATSDDNASIFTSFSDWSYLNPRAVRAEERDRLSRKAVAALKVYDRAADDIYRLGYEEVESNNLQQRPTEMSNTMPTHIPTLPHFVALLMKDPHLSFLMHVALPFIAAADVGTSTSSVTKAKQLERLVFQLGRALYRTALEYHKEDIRRINRQKSQVAAALLDSFVQDEWRMMLELRSDTHEMTQVKDDVTAMARSLGKYKPFESRVLDESGFPTDARMDDYSRWMAPPART